MAGRRALTGAAVVAEDGSDGGRRLCRGRPRRFRGSWARAGRRRGAGRHGEDDDVGGDGRSVLEQRLEVTGGAVADGMGVDGDDDPVVLRARRGNDDA